MARQGAFLCGQARGISLWPGAMPSMWLDAGAFIVVRRGALPYGQARGRSVRPGCEDLLCGQARGLSLRPGARAFYVARRGHPLMVRCKPRREMRECIILKKMLPILLFSSQHRIFVVVN